MYLEQCLMYTFLLTSAVISGVFYQLDETNVSGNLFTGIKDLFWPQKTQTRTVQNNLSSVALVDGKGFQLTLLSWLVISVYVFIAWIIVHYGLKPKRLWALARWCHSGTYSGMIFLIFK